MAKKATRESYGEALALLADTNKDVVVLDADLSKSTKTELFLKKAPDRFFDCGIAEGNMIGVAAGLAAAGKIPFASSFAMFAAGRAFEQIRNSVGYPHLNVKVCATHAGISVGEDGATHQCCEDIGLMRTIPGMVVISPADDLETKEAIKAVADYKGPVYMRLGRLAVEDVNDPATYKFEIGKGVTLKDGKDLTIIANGLMVSKAMAAAKTLEEEGVSVRVINIHTIKPLDKELVVKAAKETGLIITAEEHNIVGGLGEAVCAAVCEECPVPVIRVGVEDVFGSSGPAEKMLEVYGLTAENIVNKAKAALAKK
ncbi:MAG: transketolase family protein [Oscillospiraceae bacterium]|nr:transketolase family protein [Oscillospiraceae bacterium]MBQ7083138.1 transketolase family protein [Oscillospiraceae bacterium]